MKCSRLVENSKGESGLTLNLYCEMLWQYKVFLFQVMPSV